MRTNAVFAPEIPESTDGWFDRNGGEIGWLRAEGELRGVGFWRR
jgi:hypothetical protein